MGLFGGSSTSSTFKPNMPTKLMNRLSMMSQSMMLPLQRQAVGLSSGFMNPQYSVGGFRTGAPVGTGGGSFGSSPFSFAGLLPKQMKQFSRLDPTQIGNIQKLLGGQSDLLQIMQPASIKQLGKMTPEQIQNMMQLFGGGGGQETILSGGPGFGGSDELFSSGGGFTGRPGGPGGAVAGGPPKALGRPDSMLMGAPDFMGKPESMPADDPLSRVLFGTPEEGVAAEYLRGLTDINALKGAAGKTLSDIVTPGIEAKLIAAGMGRGGALPELLAQEGTRMALPLLAEQRGATSNLAQFLNSIAGRRMGMTTGFARPFGAPFTAGGTTTQSGGGGFDWGSLIGAGAGLLGAPFGSRTIGGSIGGWFGA